MPELISESYRELNKKLHKENETYGTSGARQAEVVRKVCESLKTTDVLDYGCGKGMLAHVLNFPIKEYDPCVEGKDSKPEPADFVVCSDVLEHIEIESLDAVLEDLNRLTKKMAYLVIHSGPASKVLADGRNAHLIQEDFPWWIKKLSKYFKVKNALEKRFSAVTSEIHIFVTPKRVYEPRA